MREKWRNFVDFLTWVWFVIRLLFLLIQHKLYRKIDQIMNESEG